MYLTVRRLPLAMISSVTTVTKRGCDSSTLCGPSGTSMKANLPSSLVVPEMPPRSRSLTVTPGSGFFLKRSRMTPSKLICGAAFTISSLMTKSYLYVIFTGAGWLSISAGSNTNCFTAVIAAASKSAPPDVTTSTSPTLPSASISIERVTEAVTPASCLSFGYSAGTNLISFGALVICGSSAAAAPGRSNVQIASARTTNARADLIRSIGQLEAGREHVSAPVDRLPARHRRLEAPSQQRRLDRGVERGVDAGQDLDLDDLAAGADDEARLELSLQPVLLRLGIKAVV